MDGWMYVEGGGIPSSGVQSVDDSLNRMAVLVQLLDLLGCYGYNLIWMDVTGTTPCFEWMLRVQLVDLDGCYQSNSFTWMDVTGPSLDLYQPYIVICQY